LAGRVRNKEASKLIILPRSASTPTTLFSQGQQFTYIGGQLSSVQTNGSTTQSYSYDSSMNTTNGNAAVGLGNRLLTDGQGGNYTYDKDGNVVSYRDSTR
jgi:hypothetical protein